MVADLRKKFEDRFGSSPVIGMAPGRINLIGEHTDYNEGFVLPGAVDLGIYFAIQKNRTGHRCCIALDKNEEVKLDSSIVPTELPGWALFLQGSCLALKNLEPESGFDCMITSTLPEGAGLSSSSALTVGFLFVLNALFDLGKNRREIALLAHHVERNHVGLRGGIMDQYASVMGETGKLLLIDCRTTTHTLIPADFHDTELFLVNSNVRHDLIRSDYNIRSDECARAVEYLQQKYPDLRALRDIDSQLLEVEKSSIDSVLWKRMRYVFTENKRVLRAVELLRKAAYPALGQLLYESHAGLRDEYEVSCAELDYLVDQASTFPGVLGTRMMGGGFGGCIIGLALPGTGRKFFETVSAAYLARFGFTPTYIPVKLDQGARILK